MWKRAQAVPTVTEIYNKEVCQLSGLHYKKLPWYVIVSADNRDYSITSVAMKMPYAF